VIQTWRSPTRAEVRAVDVRDVFGELRLRRGEQRVEEGVFRGVQVLRSLPARDRVLRRFQPEDAEQVAFVIHDRKHGVVREYPGDQVTPPGTPAEEDWPELISPAYFRPEVLSKYKGDPDKYELTDTTLDCRGGWSLRSYDVNDAGQVHAYLGDLWELPRSEQLYWRSFNEEPKSGMAERAIAQDFERRPWEGPDPLRELKQTLIGFPRATHGGAPVEIWSLGGGEPRRAFGRLHYVATESRKEWEDQVRELAKVVVEGLHERPIRAVARALEVDDPDLRSIKLLRKCLEAAGVDPALVAAVHDPLAKLSGLRSTSGAAHRGSGGPGTDLRAHYRRLVTELGESVRLLAEQVRGGAFDLPRRGAEGGDEADAAPGEVREGPSPPS
jgi:hypothetical protein